MNHEQVIHAIEASDITNIRIGIPAPALRSETARAAEAMGFLSFDTSDTYVMHVTFDHAVKGQSADLRPALPVVLHW